MFKTLRSDPEIWALALIVLAYVAAQVTWQLLPHLVPVPHLVRETGPWLVEPPPLRMIRL